MIKLDTLKNEALKANVIAECNLKNINGGNTVTLAADEGDGDFYNTDLETTDCLQDGGGASRPYQTIHTIWK